MWSPYSFWQWPRNSLLAVLLGCLALPAMGQGDAASSASEAASSQSSSEKPIYTSAAERDNELLAKALLAIAKADEIQWLETPNEKLISLYKAGETRKTKGVLLIVHAPETPQLWPSTLENLRRNLPISGWATMALPVPARYPASVPERESSSAASTNADQASSGSASSSSASSAASSSSAASEAASASSSAASEAAKPTLPRNQLVIERVEAAVAQLNKIGQFNLVILVDNSSAPEALTALYSKINTTTTTKDTIDGPVQALVLVNLQDQEPLTKEQLKVVFSVSDMPVMDVFFNPDNQQQKEVRRLHRAEAMRQNIKDYQQLIMAPEPPVAADDTQSFWLGKVHGFMERKAVSSELSNPSKATTNPVEMK